MKTTFLAAALMTMVGCAQGLSESGASDDLRGSIHVASEAKLLVAGPATHVHTSVNDGKEASLFMVNAVNGDDHDCAIALASARTHAPVLRDQVVPEGRELCVASTSPTEVLWHAHAETSPKAVALQ